MLYQVRQISFHFPSLQLRHGSLQEIINIMTNLNILKTQSYFPLYFSDSSALVHYYLLFSGRVKNIGENSNYLKN